MEAVWLSSTNPLAMLAFRRGQASERKFRLHGVAFCRAFWHMRSQPFSRLAIELSERFADGMARAAELELARQRCPPDPGFLWSGLSDHLLRHQWDNHDRESWGESTALTPSEHGDLIRDIFGNPFRPVIVDSTWQTSNVTGLAQAIYEERAFDRLPILADALEDAGCTNRDILDHCRQPGEHVRGCWVVDLLLGKA
jgi:hypothetical protein